MGAATGGLSTDNLVSDEDNSDTEVQLSSAVGGLQTVSSVKKTSKI